MTETSLHGSFAVPGDKSISHRALIFSALCQGKVTITGLSPAEDCQSTAQCMRELGLTVTADPTEPGRYTVDSPGLAGLTAPRKVLDAGNSGTTIRVMSGLVAGLPFTSSFDGDSSLRKRPMKRVLDLLTEMGAEVEFAEKPGCAPFSITGTSLTGKEFNLSVASAQVQTALLLAGLQAEGTTQVTLPEVARDHTLRMFRHMGVPFEEPSPNTVRVQKLKKVLSGFTIAVPADISSAAFFMVGAACLKGSDVTLRNCGINAGRTLVFDVLKRMGANIELVNEQEISGEPVADIRVRYNGRLQGTTIYGGEVASGVDEIPILSIAGALCDGKFTVEGAEELRHKESDRLSLITDNLREIGALVETRQDGFTLTGQEGLPGGGSWTTHLDHRMAMTGLIVNLLCRKPTSIEETDSPKISYPTFQQDLESLLTPTVKQAGSKG
ncbi:MAG TPA: 3-phosphoshikimate 1-carboxyvinyltransferase [Drouetiella sp.]